MASIGSEIARLRSERGWSRIKLREKTGLSTSYLHYVEHDEVLPSAGKLRTIVKTLGGDPEPLVRLRDEIELRRLGADAKTVLLLREEFGELTEDEREAVRGALRELRKKERRRGR